jgi:hypothetical protein
MVFFLIVLNGIVIPAIFHGVNMLHLYFFIHIVLLIICHLDS